MSFFGLEIGRRSVMSQQTALEVTGHNISNANTPGYTRQLANLQTTRPYHAPVLTGSTKVGQMGTGVWVSEIQRIRDAFLDEQIRNENKASGYWDSMQDALAKIQVILNEPSDDGLRSVMDLFWESWQDLSAHPESEAVRSTVAERGMTLADAFNHTYKQLTELREDVNASVKIKVNEINSITQQLADLNKQILSISIAGKQPNDLKDQRDMLLDELSKIAEVKVVNDQNGMVAVQMGGRTLVQGVEYTKLDTVQDTKGMHMVIWADTGVKAQVDGGELRGLLDARGKTELPEENNPSEYKETIPEILENLNRLAKTIVIKTNELHRQGYSLNNKGSMPDGTDFFQVPSAGSLDSIKNWAEIMKVNSLIANDPKNITAAAEPTWNAAGEKINFGDGANALKIAQLKHSLNSQQAMLTTEDIPVGGAPAISFNIRYGEKIYSVNVAGGYADTAARAGAIEAAISGIPDLPAINVIADGDKIVFSTADNKFKGISDFTVGTNYGDYHVLMVKDATTDDFWRSMTANVGVQAQEAQRMVNNQDILLTQLENKRQSISGVSLDEEMTNMIKFQHAYNAAARYITTMDETLEVIVNRLGLVGR